MSGIVPNSLRVSKLEAVWHPGRRETDQLSLKGMSLEYLQSGPLATHLSPLNGLGLIPSWSKEH
jgi:hypothetical protein